MVARVAAWLMGSEAIALVIGTTIYLHGTSREKFAANHRWVRHELKHVEQYQRFGLFGFLLRYLWWSIIKGYTNNPLEVEARAAEADSTPIAAMLV